MNNDSPQLKSQYSDSELELLNKQTILTAIPKAYRDLIQLDIFDTIDSTSNYLLNTQSDDKLNICLAEYQTQGRGRQGKQWLSPYASGLCLSLKIRYDRLDYSLAGLNIALAVTIAQLLKKQGITDIGIKWPNDLIWRGRKLSGLLLESRLIKPHNSLDVVVGIGMNIKVPTTHSLTTDQAWVDLSTIFAQPVSRNAYAAMLIQACVWTLLNYPLTGATKFALNWQEFDIIYGHTVTLTMPDRTVQGIAYGIDEHGALCLQVNQEKHYFTNGEVSVRLATT